jgi:hypothetical protein
MKVYESEMLGAGIVNVAGAVLSALPVLMLMKRGVLGIMQASLLSMMVRCGVILLGLLLALGPGWGLAKMPLAIWTLCCYFPLLMTETTCLAWLTNRSAK